MQQQIVTLFAQLKFSTANRYLDNFAVVLIASHSRFNISTVSVSVCVCVCGIKQHDRGINFSVGSSLSTLPLFQQHFNALSVSIELKNGICRWAFSSFILSLFLLHSTRCSGSHRISQSEMRFYYEC